MLKLCGIVCMLMPERWTITCGGSTASKSPSELICGSAAHAPQALCLLIAAPDALVWAC